MRHVRSLVARGSLAAYAGLVPITAIGATPATPALATLSDGQRVSDSEYRSRYEHEVKRYVERFAPRSDRHGVGAAYLEAGKWAWIDDGLTSVARWARYADQHGPLKAMNPDGTWRRWEPRGVR